MSTETDKKAPWSSARDHEFPPNHWLRMVGETYHDKEDKQWYTSKIHAVKKDGHLACSCSFSPKNTQVYEPVGVVPHHRYLLCPESKRFLRRLVAARIEQKEKARGT